MAKSARTGVGAATSIIVLDGNAGKFPAQPDSTQATMNDPGSDPRMA